MYAQTMNIKIAEGPAKKVPFAAQKDSSEFHTQSIHLLVEQYQNAVAELVPPENQQLFYHGRAWKYQCHGKEGAMESRTGTAEPRQAEARLEVKRVVEHDISMLSDFILGMAKQQKSQFHQGIQAQQDEVLNLPGNTLAVPKDASMVEAYLKGIQTSEPLLDYQGNPIRAALILTPEAEERLKKEISGSEDEFDQRCEELWRQKELEAVEKETRRIARYDQQP